MRKKRLEKRLAKLMNKRETLTARALASQDVNEVRAINDELNDINDEINDVQDELDEIATEEKKDDEQRSQLPPANAQTVNGGVVASFQTPAPANQKRSNENPLETMEYR